MNCMKADMRVRRDSGFTLMELVITVSIIALALAFAGPSLQQYVKSQNVKGTAKRIYSNLQLARLTAIRENRSIRVTLTATAGAETMSIEGNDANDPVVPPVNFYSSPDSRGVRLTVPNPIIVFRPSGALQGFGQTFTVFHENPEIDKEYAITINAAGGFRLHGS